MKTLLTFKASHDGTKYVLRRATEFQGRSELEVLMHESGYPVRGSGLILSRKSLSKRYDQLLGTDYLDDVDLAPETLSAELDWYPFDAASASYVFTIMEAFGDACAHIVSPNSLTARQSWHNKVYGDANISDRTQVLQARKGFVKAFGVPYERVLAASAKRLIRLKRQRNEYAHELETDIDFNKFFLDVVLVIYQIALSLYPSYGDLRSYPFQDFHGQFSRPRSEDE
ncbi:MAG: hypothetical protein EOS73_09840 [Mesorhizobium sp.]|uniref:hypothetical protein n=1 Tax=Mesorhizobium sp. M7A.F.Ca.ET.027.02.1.1 TaxID=2496655 RepID=UPI000FD5ECFF|nr:hypothetical protein [Mesorhizobium sp. M7A.F.Ca.ET.027.02.1.1]RVD18151.1 hypothetical protein EN749_05980 [Mesorhizobium sp. M7A.F.Ca.ET.027.02.1.1]RWD09691.1 MAG: hypothetical protein EOS73_09840 [Mesorhizobium sp.]